MKLLLWAASAGLLAAGVLKPRDEAWSIVITGNWQGYVSPCGCTKPMTGGIKRAAAAINGEGTDGRSLVLAVGPLVKGTGRQDELKAETLAEFLRIADAVNFGSYESGLGESVGDSIQRLSNNKFVSGNLSIGTTSNIWIQKGPFLVTGASSKARDLPAPPQILRSLLEKAKESHKFPVLLLEGSPEQAQSLGETATSELLIVCAGPGSPSGKLASAGKAKVIVVGERGRSIQTVVWRNGSLGGVKVSELGPQFPDDPKASNVFHEYTRRVGEEKLLEMLPRSDGPDFAGNEECMRCHVTAAKAWKESAHSWALKTLEVEGQDRDPDCTGCHVVGLGSIKGFQDRAKTPSLTDVGCESCHGPSKRHAETEGRTKTSANARKACAKCHDPEHSPGFDFDEAWGKIAHGM